MGLDSSASALRIFLSQRRSLLELTAAQLSEQLQVSLHELENWEAGLTEIPFSHWNALAYALNFSFDNLLLWLFQQHMPILADLCQAKSLRLQSYAKEPSEPAPLPATQRSLRYLPDGTENPWMET